VEDIMLYDPVRSLIVAAFLIWVPTVDAAPVTKQSPEQVRAEFDALWADLLSTDEHTAGLAMLRLAARGDDTLGYLKQKLRPLNLTRQRAKELLADLGGADEETARVAFDELRYFDPRLALGDEELRKLLLDRALSNRLAAVLCDLPVNAFSGDKWHWYSPDTKGLPIQSRQEYSGPGRLDRSSGDWYSRTEGDMGPCRSRRGCTRVHR
jgi:hypothetical protein